MRSSIKWLLVVLVVAVLGYASYIYRGSIMAKVDEFTSAKSNPPASPPSSSAAPLPSIPPPALTAPPGPVRGKHFAPDGTLYMTERVSARTASGIVAINPADKVTVVKKLPGNRVRVTNGEATVEIGASQATNDLDLAREIEKREFVAHGGKL